LYEKSKHTFYVQRRFSENRAIYEIMWKNAVQPDRPQTTTLDMRNCMLDNWGYKHTLRICNTYCVSTTI